MNIKEKYTNNKLIAEFMEFSTQTDEVDNATLAYYVGDFIKADNSTNENDDNVFHPDDMQFHTSWNWLMPVVIKIMRDEASVNDEYREYLCHVLPYGRKEIIYNAAVEFIKTYNRATESEYTCDNETCRKYYWGEYNGGLCCSCSDDE
jgi:hypothetical protein